jgi:hypothetical protein
MKFYENLPIGSGCDTWQWTGRKNGTKSYCLQFFYEHIKMDLNGIAYDDVM